MSTTVCTRMSAHFLMNYSDDHTNCRKTAAEEAAMVDVLVSQCWLCIQPQIFHRSAQLLLTSEVLLRIRTAAASELGEHSRIASHTSKLPCVAQMSSTPLPFCFTDVKPHKPVLVFTQFPPFSEWTPHCMHYITSGSTMTISTDILY